MVATHSPHGYRLEVSPAERDALLTALEFATATARGEDGRTTAALARDLDAAALDKMTDAVFLAGAPA